MTKSERVKLALMNVDNHARRRLIRETVAAIGLPEELAELAKELQQIQNIGRAVAEEIVLHLALLIAEKSDDGHVGPVHQ